ncbi:probable serine/threonine-protein kinase DDB_G0282963 isoform X2 [Tetranychus urticae]|uniref:probable serine/threonine-protein kinase DDB_G0282963 isoform X2 n=1 Tax=Tetranychus urticae TaxID=32264 RepID=UPI00077B8503|nr:probable serine/threonine-protein kinase DDB_G0282963 isoform X2 [Tetranychus urticae]
MTSSELNDGNKKVNNGDKEEENEPKSFRAEYARKSHNNIEKKRKDKIAIWINKIYELLPKDPKKESKNGILEKAYHYMVHLKEMNDKLIYGNADQITGEELRFARKKITKLEETNAVYYKILKMSGITPNNIPLDAMKPLTPKNAKLKQDKINLDKVNPSTNSADDNSDAASDTTEVIRDDDNADQFNKNGIQDSTQNAPVTERMNINSLFQKTPLLVVNQNLDQNAPRISLSNGSQLKIRPSPNVQILGNGALAIDSSGFNQGPIILGSTLLSPPQPTTLLMSNGQLISLVNQPQPAFVYTPGAGFVLTSSTPINNSINVPVKPTEQAEKGKKKTRVTVNNEPEANSMIVTPETKVTQTRPKRSRTYQKANSKQVPISEVLVENDQSTNEQQNETSTPAVKSRKRPRIGRVSRKSKETSDKLTISEVNLQSDSASVIKEKRPRPTTVIERVADSPVKSCTADKQANKNVNSSKGSAKEFDETLTTDNTSKKLIPCNDLTSNDLETEDRIDYSFRQNSDNNETACDQDQLPLLLSSLSDDHEMSTESVHSVSNSSLPTFLSLSPPDHLTDFLSKTTDHNSTARSPRYSSSINRLNTSAPTSQTPSVIMSNQGTNLISEPHHLMGQNDKDPMFEGNLESSNKNMEPEMQGKDSDVSMCVDENYSNSINHHHHHHHHLMINEREPIESSAHGSNDDGADSGQSRLYTTDSQENRRSETNKSTNSLTEIGLRKSSEASTSSSTVPTVTTTTSLSSNVNASSSSGNNSGTSQERNFLPYSAESLLRQQPQQQSTTMPTSGPINSIYHVHSNVDPNIDFSNRGTASASSNNVSSNSRPTISYSAERLIHSPPIDTTVSANQSSRHKSHEANKVSSMPNNNQSNNSANIYNEQYSIIRTARGSTDMDSNLSRIQSNHHQHHAQQQQHPSNVYRTSPQTQDQRTNQDQHQSSRNSNPTSQSQQQIMHQQRDVYPENHLHHHQQPPPPQSSRSQTQANSSSQGQISMKTTSTSDSSTTNANNGSNSNSNTTANNNSTNNGREIFNHPYPYGPMPNDGSSSGDRNDNHATFANNGNHQNDGFIEGNSQNNFIPPFAPPNNNCQPSFNATNNRRSGSSSTAMLAPFPFSDPLNSSTSFSSDPYSRPANTPSSNASSVVNFDTNRRIGNSGHFVDHTSSTANNSNNNYFMMHNHHVVSSALPNSNNPPIFSTSSSFPSLISSSTNSNYDNNGYNLTCPPRPSSNVNTTVNISGSTNTISNSNLHSHHHSHHSVFYGDTSTPPMHNSRRQSELSPYSASSKSVNNGGSSGSSKTPNNATASTPPTNSKQSGKSVGGSSKSTKKGSTANAAKSRGQSSNNDTRLSINNPPVVNSYPSMPSFVPPPSSSSMVNHRSVVTPSSSSTASALNVSSSERSIDGGESLFRPQPQSNSANNMQTSSTRSSGPSSHSLPPVGHSSTFLPNFSFNIFPEIGSINPNENFAMSGLSAIKFNHANHVLPHHPNPNAPFTHSSALQAPGSMDNSASVMGDNSSHQNIYGHHSRISTPHHHNHVSFIPLIGTSPRTLK